MSKKTDKKEAPKKEEPKKEAKKEAAPPEVEAPKEEVKPAKAEKAPKPEKKKKEEKGVFTLYKVEGEKVVRLRPICERCGLGYFMADHGNRYTCGHCGFTKYKPAKE
ncbi:MAG TPA: 30S ribosomal protein S27ae [Patescibacteria group bacterium]|nr:30S ribosomal protein S27ae [Patescibacteria group bacterium]